MADAGTSTNINFTKAESTISEWNQAALSFSSSFQKAANDPCLQDLASAGLESGFISSYDKRFEDLASNIKTMTSELSTVIKAFYEADTNTATPTASVSLNTNGGGRNTGGGGGGGNNGGGGGNQNSTPTTTTTATTTPTATTSGQEDHDKVYEALSKEFGNISMEGLDGLAAELIKYCETNNISIEKFLTDSEYATKLHSLLAKSTNLSDSLKTLITGSSTSVTQEVLRDVFSGKLTTVVGLNDDTSSIYLAYLQSIAVKNNISVEDLATDPKYDDIVKTTFTEFGKISGIFNGMSDEEIVARAKEIYDGKNIDKLDQETVNIIRAYMEVEAQDKNCDVQELTKDDAHLFKDLSKFGSMSKVVANESNSKKQDAIINILNAKKEDKVSQTTTSTTTTTTPATTSTTTTESSTTSSSAGGNVVRTSELVVEDAVTSMPEASELPTTEISPQDEISTTYNVSDEQPYVEPVVTDTSYVDNSNVYEQADALYTESAPVNTDTIDSTVDNTVSSDSTLVTQLTVNDTPIEVASESLGESINDPSVYPYVEDAAADYDSSVIDSLFTPKEEEPYDSSVVDSLYTQDDSTVVNAENTENIENTDTSVIDSLYADSTDSSSETTSNEEFRALLDDITG